MKIKQMSQNKIPLKPWNIITPPCSIQFSDYGNDRSNADMLYQLNDRYSDLWDEVPFVDLHKERQIEFEKACDQWWVDFLQDDEYKPPWCSEYIYDNQNAEEGDSNVECVDADENVIVNVDLEYFEDL